MIRAPFITSFRSQSRGALANADLKCSEGRGRVWLICDPVFHTHSILMERRMSNLLKRWCTRLDSNQ